MQSTNCITGMVEPQKVVASAMLSVVDTWTVVRHVDADTFIS